jgi:hypothetical protein
VGAAGESATADAQQALKSAISGSSALPGAANSLATLAEVDVNSDIRQLQVGTGGVGWGGVGAHDGVVCVATKATHATCCPWAD